MTEKQARYFMEVYHRRNIALAAKALFVSRPVVSRALSDLEHEFGAKFFSRTNIGVQPTDAGIMLYQLISDIAVNYTAVAAAIKKSDDAEASRVVRFGVTPTNAYKVYNMLLCGFVESYPDVNLSIMENPALELSELLLSGVIDIAFTPLRHSKSNLDSMDGYQSKFALGVSTNSPLAQRTSVSISDILDLSFGFLGAPMPYESVLHNYFSIHGVQPNIAVRLSNLELLKKMAQDGKIAVVLPDDIISEWENIATITLDFFAASTHKLVWNKLITHNSAFDDLLNYAGQVFGERNTEAWLKGGGV